MKPIDPKDRRIAITPEFAARIEKASRGALPREKLSPVCAACPYSKLPRGA